MNVRNGVWSSAVYSTFTHLDKGGGISKGRKYIHGLSVSSPFMTTKGPFYFIKID
jgi:hypothetical protein